MKTSSWLPCCDSPLSPDGSTPSTPITTTTTTTTITTTITNSINPTPVSTIGVITAGRPSFSEGPRSA
ncbi:hypothetical protein ACOMHN_035159 [Nucella lapillus]